MTEHDRRAEADALRSALDDPSRTASLVVVGEAKRGKSTLVNALVARPGLARVGVDIVTSAYTSYLPPGVPAAPPPGQALILLADGTRVDTPATQAWEWTSVDGPRSGDPRGVAGALVGLDRPGPVNAVLVDTPGVGGLRTSHGDVALRAAAAATVLLLVTDAGQELTSTELAFVQAAAGRVDVVVFAVTKCDKDEAAWPAVVERNRHLLREHAPRFGEAPIVAVSGLLACEALITPDPATAGLLNEAARLDDLVAVLNDTLGRGLAALVAGNVARATVTSLRALETEAREHHAAVNDSSGTADRVTQEEAALKDLLSRQQSWGEAVQLQTGRARRQLLTRFDEAAVDVEAGWLEQTKALTRQQLLSAAEHERVMGSLALQLQDVQDRLVAGHRDDLTRRLGTVFGGHAQLADLLPRLLEETAALVGEQTLTSPTSKGPVRGEFTTRLARTSVMGIGSTMALSHVLGPLAFPLGVGAVLALTRLTGAKQDAEASRRAMVEVGSRATSRLRTEVVRVADSLVEELRPQLNPTVREHLEQRRKHLAAVLEEARKASRSPNDERLRRRTETLRRLRSFTTALTALEQWLATGPDLTPQRAAAATPSAAPATTPTVTVQTRTARRPRDDW